MFAHLALALAAPAAFCNGPWGAYPSGGACNYAEAHWGAFVAALKRNRAVTVGTLTRSSGGRDIPLLEVGPRDGRHRALVYWQARQHCREWKTNYALEGAVRWVLSAEPQAAWVRRNVRLVIVPWVNIDKCLANSIDRGDDGHDDLNRVWLKEPPQLANPAVRAIKALLRRETRADLPAVAFDWHSPNRDGGGGAGFQHSFMTWNSPHENKQRSALLVQTIRAHATSRNVVDHHGKDNATKPGMFSVWGPSLPGMKSVMTPEVRENSLDVEDARGLGRDALVGVARWLRDTYLEPAAAPDTAMHFPGRVWEQVPPEEEGLDPAALDLALRFLANNAGRDRVHETVVVRNGRLMWAGPHAARAHGVWSITKSFTTTALGLLVDDEVVSLDTRAATLVPAMSARFPTVTLRHLATMTSGYSAVGDQPRPDGYRHGPSATPFVPGEPRFAPGTRFEYWDSAMNQLAHAVTAAAREPLAALFQRRLAGPMDMDPSVWRWGDFGPVNGTLVNGGAGNHDRHVVISAHQLARLGHLFLNRGRWRDRQLLSPEWVDQATRGQLGAARGERPDDYGFGWWVNAAGADGQRRWPGAPAATFAASGFNNNDLFVVPEWRMVIARLGQDQKEQAITDAVHGEFLRLVGEAIRADSGAARAADRRMPPRPRG